jgi:hypothetical protein
VLTELVRSLFLLFSCFFVLDFWIRSSDGVKRARINLITLRDIVEGFFPRQKLSQKRNEESTTMLNDGCENFQGISCFSICSKDFNLYKQNFTEYLDFHSSRDGDDDDDDDGGERKRRMRL